jgi:hypothetical protein
MILVKVEGHLRQRKWMFIRGWEIRSHVKLLKKYIFYLSRALYTMDMFIEFNIFFIIIINVCIWMSLFIF